MEAPEGIQVLGMRQASQSASLQPKAESGGDHRGLSRLVHGLPRYAGYRSGSGHVEDSEQVRDRVTHQGQRARPQHGGLLAVAGAGRATPFRQLN